MRASKDCASFSRCSAPLCPLDPELKKRIWYPGERFCTRHGRLRWVKKQRKLNRKCPKCWQDYPMRIVDLIKISRPHKLTEEQKIALRERFKNARYKRKEAFLLRFL